ncbi:glycerophosphodiester phosphodiesterase [Alicyclobacillus fastidiosus]|uniref:Glycerophosphodiester phosphodiesterase n=1 Tax=Alicyclobacillus fastidiosus TaxID=392011 RepID=A0ABY6ZLY3_9BACL|nr:glycerophosphodiester phosphodiesterase family protein [Alicyclobacillus fastidiosus]WAH43608.1 glycerophosphodiester phosphodiesterase [Alicyclobacillus fastidiosus]GMA59795.1 glycerophosphoryl diester phosphodiesterase [Alicyclobacillus fastidiosus]
MHATPRWAHRGYAGRYPENTLVAFVAGAEVGAEGIECDVRLTKDGQFVILHDECVDRTTNGHGRVADLSLEEIQDLDAGAWFHDAFVGTRIPTLETLVDYIAQYPRRIALNLEWKVPVPDDALMRRAFDVICRAGIFEQVLHSSFHEEILRAIRRVIPNTRVALLTEPGREAHEVIQAAKAIGAVAIHPDFRQVTPRFVRRAHQSGLRVHPYTVDDAKMMAWMEECGVDAIITNWPLEHWSEESGPAISRRGY